MPSVTRNLSYYANYTPIRNALRKYAPASILERVLDYLYQPEPDNFRRLQKVPWVGLLLIKWAFIDEQSAIPGRPQIPESKFFQLYQAACELGDHARLPNDYEHLFLCIRAIGYQQFFFQRPFGLLGIARQELLFAKVPENHFFKTTFQREAGLSIEDFLRLSCVLVARFFQAPGYEIKTAWFSTLSARFSKETIEAFLRSLALDVQALPLTLRSLDKSGRQASEYHAQTPFLSHPLIRIGERFLCVHPHVLLRCCEHFVYDVLKRTNAVKFNQSFGKKIFERYVGQRLHETGLPMATEDELEEALPGTGKVIDFLLCDSDANVFIDAKGVEMAERGKVAHLQEVIYGATSSSLIEAVMQAHVTNARLSGVTQTHAVIRKRAQNYLVVITYKELFIGNGDSLRDAIGHDKFNALCGQCESGDLIPPENMYFMTIEELEHYLEYVKAGKLGFVQGLEKAKETDAIPQTRKFFFEMHMSEWGRPLEGQPAVLGAVIDEMLDEFGLLLSGQS